MTFTYPSHTTKGCVPLSSDVSVTEEDDAEQENREEAAPVIIVYDYSDVTEMDDIAEWYLEEEVA